MTFEQMKILRAVVEQGGIIAASKVLFKTQPAVSNMINRLEAQLEVKLFTRDGYRVQLTPEGQALYGQIKGILAQVETVEALAKNFSAGSEPLVRISVEALTPVNAIMEVLHEVQSLFPYTCVSITTDTLYGGVEKLEKGEVDLALVPQSSQSVTMESAPVTTTELVPVFAKQHPSVADSLKLSKQELLEAIHIVIPDSSSKPADTQMLTRDGARCWHAADFNMKKQMIMNGLGWGYMPIHLVEAELELGQLVIVDLEAKPRVPVTVHVLKNIERPLGPVASLLWDLLGNVGVRVE